MNRLGRPAAVAFALVIGYWVLAVLLIGGAGETQASSSPPLGLASTFVGALKAGDVQAVGFVAMRQSDAVVDWRDGHRALHRTELFAPLGWRSLEGDLKNAAQQYSGRVPTFQEHRLSTKKLGSQSASPAAVGLLFAGLAVLA